MAHKTSNQPDLADTLIFNNQTLNQRLDNINELVDWAPFELKLNIIYSSSTGRPSYPPLLLFKALLLQTWYTLSDYELEAALDDRLSFRRFVRMSLSEKAPDHSTFSRFRDQLIMHKVHDQLFIELAIQLESKGLILKKGTLIDATVVTAAPKAPKQNEDGSAGKSEVDPEADWTKKGGRFLFGYKAHVGVDQESELIRKIVMTSASVNDGKMLCHVLSGDEKWAYADKAYDSKKNDEILKKQGVKNGILIKGTCSRKLLVIEKMCNKILSKLRSPIERIFGTLKRSYRYNRAKYLGLRKNMLQLTLMSLAYNLRRMEKLCAKG